jgi:hypothetical protein
MNNLVVKDIVSIPRERALTYAQVHAMEFPTKFSCNSGFYKVFYNTLFWFDLFVYETYGFVLCEERWNQLCVYFGIWRLIKIIWVIISILSSLMSTPIIKTYKEVLFVYPSTIEGKLIYIIFIFMLLWFYYIGIRGSYITNCYIIRSIRILRVFSYYWDISNDGIVDSKSYFMSVDLLTTLIIFERILAIMCIFSYFTMSVFHLLKRLEEEKFYANLLNSDRGYLITFYVTWLFRYLGIYCLRALFGWDALMRIKSHHDKAAIKKEWERGHLKKHKKWIRIKRFKAYKKRCKLNRRRRWWERKIFREIKEGIYVPLTRKQRFLLRERRIKYSSLARLEYEVVLHRKRNFLNRYGKKIKWKWRLWERYCRDPQHEASRQRDKQKALLAEKETELMFADAHAVWKFLISEGFSNGVNYNAFFKYKHLLDKLSLLTKERIELRSKLYKLIDRYKEAWLLDYKPSFNMCVLEESLIYLRLKEIRLEKRFCDSELLNLERDFGDFLIGYANEYKQFYRWRLKWFIFPKEGLDYDDFYDNSDNIII